CNAAQATAAAGGSVTMQYSITSDWWGIVGVEVIASGGAAESERVSFRPGKTWRRRFKHRQRLALDLTVTADPNFDPTQAGGLGWQYNRAATHVDRRSVPQYTLRESSVGLLDTAQLEVPPPLPITYGEAATYKDRRLVPQQRSLVSV